MLAAASPALGQLIADQRATGCAKYSTRDPLAVGIDRTADQCAQGGANQQANRAVAGLAVIAVMMAADRRILGPQ